MDCRDSNCCQFFPGCRDEYENNVLPVESNSAHNTRGRDRFSYESSKTYKDGQYMQIVLEDGPEENLTNEVMRYNEFTY